MRCSPWLAAPWACSWPNGASISFSATVGKPQGADWLDLAVDGHVVLFALGAALVTALLFGLAPAIKATRVDLRGVLQEDRRTSGPGPGPRRLRGLLVAGQVALSIALVAAARRDRSELDGI